MGILIWTIDLGDLGERDVDVLYDYDAPYPAVLYGPNMHPEEPEEISLRGVMLDRLDLLGYLTDNVLDRIQVAISEREKERRDDEADRRAAIEEDYA